MSSQIKQTCSCKRHAWTRDFLSRNIKWPWMSTRERCSLLIALKKRHRLHLEKRRKVLTTASENRCLGCEETKHLCHCIKDVIGKEVKEPTVMLLPQARLYKNSNCLLINSKSTFLTVFCGSFDPAKIIHMLVHFHHFSSK